MPVWLIALLSGLIVGTLVEYWGHRLMHWRLLKKKHVAHHKEGGAQGWFWEFFDYFLPTSLIMCAGFVYSLEAGVGFAAGGLLFAMFAAYSHQLQHEKPDLCFWMIRPVHYIHHEHHMWKTNFGISVDVWDRVFMTYKYVEYKRERKHPWWSLFFIKWI